MQKVFSSFFGGVYVYKHTCVCRNVCTSRWTCIWRSEVNSDAILQVLLTVTDETASQWDLEPTQQARPSGHWAGGIYLFSASPELGLYALTLTCLAFTCGFWGLTSGSHALGPALHWLPLPSLSLLTCAPQERRTQAGQWAGTGEGTGWQSPQFSWGHPPF